MTITFLDRVKKLVYQIHCSLEEQEYNVIELNLEVLNNLIIEKQDEATSNKDYLVKNLDYFKTILSSVNKSFTNQINSILQQPPLQ